MAKQKKQTKKKGAKAQKNQALRVMRGGGPTEAGTHALTVAAPALKHAQMMCNPFNPRLSTGCRYPDGNAGFTVTSQVRGIYPFPVTTASGAAWACFVANYPYNFVTGTLSAGTWTTGTAASAFTNAFTTTLAASPNEFRVVCAGIILRNTQSAMNAQGTVLISKIPQGISPGGGTWTSGSLFGDSIMKPIHAGMEICVLFKPSGVDFSAFHKANSVALETDNWDAISVEIIGGGNALIQLEVEYIMNLEHATYSSNQGYQAIAQQSVDLPLARNISKSVWSKVGSVIEGGVEFATKKLGQLAISAVAARFGGPKAGMSAYAAIRDVD